jgi:hypothetical protein
VESGLITLPEDSGAIAVDSSYDDTVLATIGSPTDENSDVKYAANGHELMVEGCKEHWPPATALSASSSQLVNTMERREGCERTPHSHPTPTPPQRHPTPPHTHIHTRSHTYTHSYTHTLSHTHSHTLIHTSTLPLLSLDFAHSLTLGCGRQAYMNSFFNEFLILYGRSTKNTVR